MKEHNTGLTDGQTDYLIKLLASLLSSISGQSKNLDETLSSPFLTHLHNTHWGEGRDGRKCSVCLIGRASER